MSVQNTNTGLGTQNNHNAPGQNINYGGDQIVMVNVGPHKSLWDAISGVGASHRAEQQYSRGECLEGTRIEVLRVIHEWRTSNSDVPPILWLSGPVGVGKTAIAMTVAKSCEEDGLIESFFFFRSDSMRNNPSALMLTIAHGLGMRIPRLEPLISGRITTDPKILEATLEMQFQELILKPSLAQEDPGISPITPSNPNLVIIDGLDECGGSADQLRILAIIGKSYQHTPRFPLRFLICSRSESWIRQTFKAVPLRDITRSIVLDKMFDPGNDIERYLIHELEGIRNSPEYEHVEFPTPWPSQEDYDCLVKRSDGQFVYVVTAVKFVKIPHCHPVKQLHSIIDNALVNRPPKSPYPELDNLYHVVLEATPDHDIILTILAILLLSPHKKMDAEERTRSPEWLELLLGLSSGEIFLTLRAMHSVLEIQGPKDPIRVYHTSFTDYLFDPTRSGKFYVVDQQYVLAWRWGPALPRGTQSVKVYNDDLAWRYILAERWLLALSREGIGEYR
ncbi:hypothetical protein V5O48_011862 [Marasmius crinis-equi]|uniref:Nephrocystin 3-like N-terminal domain-containing protein n=1 Tax=Marasmius crinis-equi TaxID=585013 RepID=A0ABR3F4G0_9AGAR